MTIRDIEEELLFDLMKLGWDDSPNELQQEYEQKIFDSCLSDDEKQTALSLIKWHVDDWRMST